MLRVRLVLDVILSCVRQIRMLLTMTVDNILSCVSQMCTVTSTPVCVIIVNTMKDIVNSTRHLVLYLFRIQYVIYLSSVYIPVSLK